MLAPTVIFGRREPWNKGKLVGQKAPLKLRDIWAIRVRLEMTDRKRELALFNLAIDSKLRGCDLVKLRVRDVAHGDRIAARTAISPRLVRFCLGAIAAAAWLSLGKQLQLPARFPRALSAWNRPVAERSSLAA
jgi:hypothetical protein